MADAGEMARLFERGLERSTVQEHLQRDFTIELGIPGAVDGAERAVPDGLEQNEVAPDAGRGDRSGERRRRGGSSPSVRCASTTVASRRSSRDDLLALGGGARGHDAVPVDGLAVADVVRRGR